MEKTRRGMVFATTALARTQVEAFNRSEYLTSKDKDYIKAVITLCSEDEEGMCDEFDLQEHFKSLNKASSRGAFQNRNKELVSKRLFLKSEHRGEGKRPSTKYVLQPIEDLSIGDTTVIELEKYHSRATTAHRQRRGKKEWVNEMEQSNSHYLRTIMSREKAYAEDLFTGIFDRGMRITDREKVDGNAITVRLKIGKEFMVLTTTSSSDGSVQIAHLGDQRILRAIVTYVVQTINQEKLEKPNIEIRNKFIIDLKDICYLMQISPNNTGQERVYRAVKRLYYTVFNIKLSDPDGMIAQKFGEGFDEHHFRFISHLSTRTHDCKSSLGVPRQIEISLDPRLWERMQDPSVRNIFVTTPDILTENIGLSHTLHNFCRLVIGVKPKSPYLEKRSWELSEFRRVLMPAASLDTFRMQLRKILEKYTEENQSPFRWRKREHEVNVFGYLLRYTWDEGIENITIQRDIHDRYVGNCSTHNSLRMLAQLNQAPNSLNPLNESRQLSLAADL